VTSIVLVNRVVRLQPMRPGRRLVGDDIAVLEDGQRFAVERK
jgi:hypothetical protein